MSNEKIINSRQQQKHDIEANWLKAVNFIPKDGELIIYDADEANTIPRVKIGDGNRSVSDLPFIGEDVLQKISEIELLSIVDEGEGNLVFDGIGYGGYEEFEERIENLENNGDSEVIKAYLWYDEETESYYCDYNSSELYNFIQSDKQVVLACEEWDDCVIYPCYANEWNAVFLTSEADSCLYVYNVTEDKTVYITDMTPPTYDTDGCLISNEPIEDWHVATKGYVDSNSSQPIYAVLTYYQNGERRCNLNSQELYHLIVDNGCNVRLTNEQDKYTLMPVYACPSYVTFLDYDAGGGIVYLYVVDINGRVAQQDIYNATYNKNDCLISRSPTAGNEVANKDYVDITAWENACIYVDNTIDGQFLTDGKKFDDIKIRIQNGWFIYAVIKDYHDNVRQYTSIDYDSRRDAILFGGFMWRGDDFLEKDE